jgi:hypothetical protein
MSFLRLEETPPPPQDPSPAKKDDVGIRYIAIVSFGACVFGITAIALLKVVPAPFKGLDYMVIGTMSVMAALLAVFLLVTQTSAWKGRG